MPVAMAYVSDIHPSRAEKDKEIGGGTKHDRYYGRGYICYFDARVGAVYSFAALSGAELGCFLFHVCVLGGISRRGQSLRFEEDASDDDGKNPETIDTKVMANVIFGAVCDNF